MRSLILALTLAGTAIHPVSPAAADAPWPDPAGPDIRQHPPAGPTISTPRHDPAGSDSRRHLPTIGAPGRDPAGSDTRRDLPAEAGAGTAAPAPRFTSDTVVAPGVVFRTFRTTGAAGPVLGDLLEVDLRNPHTRVGLLHPPVVAARRTVTDMADAQGAVAGVNGDFFNISETRPGVVPTGSSNGPEVAEGRDLKGAVPDGQRFGRALPPGTSTEDVIGVGRDRLARLGRLHLTGTVRTDGTRFALRGLNQYAIPVGGVGAFTRDWGPVSRQRAVCGTDAVRNDPCSTDTAEVTVRRGVVASVGAAVGAGDVPPDTTVLVGRERGADRLRALRPGDRVRIGYHLASDHGFRFAVGGFPIRRDGRPVAGLETAGSAPRTAAGVSRTGRTLYLVVVDGRSQASRGMTLAELSGLLGRFGADDGVNLDGGGSSTFAVRGPGEAAASVRNVPSGGVERAVANGIGVFTRP